MQSHHVDFDAAAQVVHERLKQGFGVVIVPEAGVDQVDAEDADGLLLEAVVVVEQPDVQHQVIGFGGGVQLEAQSEPAVAFDGFLKIDGRHGIGECEKILLRAFFAQAPFHQLVFVVEHAIQARFAHITALCPPCRIFHRLRFCHKHSWIWRWCPPLPHLKKCRATSCPAPISANAP